MPRLGSTASHFMAFSGVSQLNSRPVISPRAPVRWEPPAAVPMTLLLASASSRSGTSAACAAGAAASRAPSVAATPTTADPREKPDLRDLMRVPPKVSVI
ncbi:hypothetical protein SGLAM104S_06415 [Streptomyces glaucescens]